VAGERRLRILDRLTGGVAPELETRRLCEVGAHVVGVSGAGIMLMSNDVAAGAVCTTDGVSALAEDLQFSLGRRAVPGRLPSGTTGA